MADAEGPTPEDESPPAAEEQPASDAEAQAPAAEDAEPGKEAKQDTDEKGTGEKRNDEKANKEKGSDKDANERKDANEKDAENWQFLSEQYDVALRSLFGDRSRNTVFLGPTTVGTIGDQYLPSGSAQFGSTVRSGTVSPVVLGRIRESFVEPSGYQQLKHRLETHQLVFLNARSGSGRTTAALRLLDQTCRTGVRKLDPDVRFKGLSPRDFEESHGYLLEPLAPEQAAELHSFHADRISQLMKDKGCMMIVVVDESTPLPTQEVGEFVVSEIGTVEAEHLLLQHIRYGLRESFDESRATALLDRPEVKEIIERLTADVPPRELAELGSLLVEVAHERADLDWVRDRYSRATDVSFIEWFDQQADPEQRAFVIALAVFNNESVKLIFEAADLLARRIKTVEVPRRIDRARPLFKTPLHQRLHEARAEVVPGTIKMKYGEVPVRSIRFRDERYPRRILDHICAQYSQEFGIVGEWLLELGKENNDRLRLRAAVATGLLSLYDFPAIHNNIIHWWAVEGDDPVPRWAAAAALRIPSGHPSFSHVVDKLLTGWVEKKDEPLSLRMSAVQALGTTEAMSLSKVLRLLKRAAFNADWSLSVVIGESLSQLFRHPEHRAQILDALLSWTDTAENSKQRRETGLLAVFIISLYLKVAVPQSTEKWPIFLWLAEYDPEQRDRTFRLFERLLVTAGFADRAYAHLERWVRRARKDPTLREPLARFLHELGARSGELDSIRAHLEYLATRKSVTRTAKALLRHLDERTRE